MTSADTLLAAGDLLGARQVLVETIKRAPADQPARMFLFQLLALTGEWDKAAAQLRALASLSPEAQILAVVYNQALAAEKQRAAAFAGGGPVPVLVSSSPWIETLAQAIGAFARGDVTRGEDLRGTAFEAAPDTPGECDGRTFGWIADADARFGPCFEAIVGGNWGLVPFEAVSAITSEGPVDLRDLIWYPVQMALRSGQTAAALLPARYPGTEDAEYGLRLGRATEWREGPSGDEGVGQRLWSFDNGDDLGILSLRRLSML
jgi:protein involved in temperature-dependent protein secretion